MTEVLITLGRAVADLSRGVRPDLDSLAIAFDQYLHERDATPMHRDRVAAFFIDPVVRSEVEDSRRLERRIDEAFKDVRSRIQALIESTEREDLGEAFARFVAALTDGLTAVCERLTTRRTKGKEK